MTSRAEYEAMPGENFSTLKYLAKSPQSYRAAKASPKEATDAMDFGTVGHIATTEPEALGERVAVWAEGKRAGKAWEAFEADAKRAGKIVLRKEDYDEAVGLAKVVRSSQQAKPYLNGGKAEVSMQWKEKDPVSGVETLCKGRVDYETDTHLVDVKFTRDASLEAFGRQMFQQWTHAQLAFYRSGRRALSGVTKDCVLIAAENTGTNIVQVYRLTVEQLERGCAAYQAWLATLHQCQQAKAWPGYWPTETDLVFPKWADREEEIDL